MITILLSQGLIFGTFTNSFENTVYAQESEFLPYENTDIGFSMKYPANWQIMKNPDEFTMVSFISPLDSSSDVIQESVLVSVTGLPESITLDDYTDVLMQGTASEFEMMGFEFNILESESITISGNEAKKITYTANYQGFNSKLVTFTTIKGNIGYSVGFTAEEEKFSEYNTTVEEMIDSIKIKSLPPVLQYENLTHGISIEYPSSWVKFELYEPVTGIGLKSPLEDLQDLYQARLAIIILDLPTTTSSQIFADMMIEEFQDFPNFQLIDSKKTTLSSIPAYQITYTTTHPGLEVKGTNIFSVLGTKAYMIQFTAEPEKFDEYMPTVQKMLDSIVIDKEIVPTEFWGKYVNDEVGLEIDFPEGWKGMKMKKDGVNMVFTSPGIGTKLFSSEVDPNFAAMIVMVSNLDSSLDIPKPECDTPYDPAKILELNGMKVFEITGKCVEPTMNVKLKMLTYGFYTDDSQISVGYFSGSDKIYEKEISKFHESLKTLKISNTIDISDPSNYAKSFDLVLDKKSIQFADQTLEFDIATNSTITDFSFDSQNEKISFRVLEQSGTGLTEVFIGKALEPPYTVTVDGKNIDDHGVTHDETTGETIVSFYYKHPVNQIVIKGTTVLDTQTQSNNPHPKIPDWIRNNASWWVEGNIDDQAFVGGIQFLIKDGLIQIPETTQSAKDSSQEIPAWIKNNADWWSQGLISDDDFLKGITFMVENGIIVV